MLDALAAAAVVALLVALGLGLLYGVTVVPFVLALAVAFAPALVLLARGDRVGGPAGRHESPL